MKKDNVLLRQQTTLYLLHERKDNRGKEVQCNKFYAAVYPDYGGGLQIGDAEKFAAEIQMRYNVHEELLSVAKRTIFLFQNESNYPEGTNGYNLRKEALSVVSKIVNKPL